MAELKPCPFCGEKPVGFFDTSRLVALVKCTNWGCAVQPMTKCYPDKQQAIDAWNKRSNIMSNMMSPKDFEDIKNGNVPSTHYQDNTGHQSKRKTE